MSWLNNGKKEQIDKEFFRISAQNFQTKNLTLYSQL